MCTLKRPSRGDQVEDGSLSTLREVEMHRTPLDQATLLRDTAAAGMATGCMLSRRGLQLCHGLPARTRHLHARATNTCLWLTMSDAA